MLSVRPAMHHYKPCRARKESSAVPVTQELVQSSVNTLKYALVVP